MSFGQWKPTITLKYQPFPKQACIHKIINEPIDSNPQDDIYNLGEHPCQKASLCSFFKGSYTLEAAVIIPVAAVFFLTLLFFFRVLQIQNMRLRWQNPICQEIILICRLIITLKFQLAFLR